MNKMTLHDIASSIEQTLHDNIDPETGEISDETMAKLDELGLELDDKAAGYGSAYRSLNARAKAMKEEAKFFTARAKALENSAERLRERLFEEMGRLGVVKIGNDRGTATIQGAKPKVIITGDVPADCLIPVDPKVDKKRVELLLKTAASLGEPAPDYAHFEESKHLRFR